MFGTLWSKILTLEEDECGLYLERACLSVESVALVCRLAYNVGPPSGPLLAKWAKNCFDM